jgi:hypothetical protein
MVVYYGSHLAGILAVFALQWQGYPIIDAVTGGLAVMCIAGICLTITALWGIRYPARAEPEPRPVILYTPVQDTGTDDLREIVRPDGQSYEATMQRRKAAPWCRLSEPKLARVLDLYKILGGSINVETYVNRHKICTRHELALLRTDLINHGLADGWKGSAVPHERGRAELLALLPHLLRE